MKRAVLRVVPLAAIVCLALAATGCKAHTEMPDVVGKTATEAEALVHQLDPAPDETQEFSDQPEGSVLRQTPSPGPLSTEHVDVALVVAKAFPSLPNVVGMNATEAKAKLTESATRTDS